MGESLKEKEFYRGSILGLVKNIDNVDILSYIYVIISDIVNENKKGA